MEYSRGFDKVWVYGALRVQDGYELTLTAASRNTQGYLQLLNAIDQANPKGELYLIMDNLSSHTSAPIRLWLADHPRIHQVPIPKGACWLNLQEAWWRLFRHEALAGQTFADHVEIERATRLATDQLNRRAKPWIWQRPHSIPRRHRRSFVYRI